MRPSKNYGSVRKVDLPNELDKDRRTIRTVKGSVMQKVGNTVQVRREQTIDWWQYWGSPTGSRRLSDRRRPSRRLRPSGRHSPARRPPSSTSTAETRAMSFGIQKSTALTVNLLVSSCLMPMLALSESLFEMSNMPESSIVCKNRSSTTLPQLTGRADGARCENRCKRSLPYSALTDGRSIWPDSPPSTATTTN
jgi:hypothetical protein